jgi:peptide/nickel transport system substrate-binding protein
MMLRWRLLPLVAALLAGPGAAETTFRIGATALPPSQGNPYVNVGTTSQFVWAAIYDTLAREDNASVLHPVLAESWRNPDPLTWVFTLRRGVQFSNGERWDAFAAKKLLDLLRLDPRGLAQPSNREPRRLTDVIAPDADTLVLKLAEPNAMLPQHLSTMQFVAPDHLDKVGFDGLSAAPVGTGPFVVERWAPDKLTLRANPTAWRKPKVDRLEFLTLPEPTARMQALQTGQIDVAIAVNPDQVAGLTAASLTLFKRTPARIFCIVFQTTDPASPFVDVRLRQAVSYAVNVRAITETLLGGMVKPASQGALPDMIGYNPALVPYPYDPDKARALLREAGKPDGFSFVIEFAAGTLSYDAAVLQQIAADLAAVGIRMEIRPISYGQYARLVVQGGWKGAALAMDYLPVGGDALRAIYRGSHSCAWNAPWFCDPEIEARVQAAGREPDLARRTAMAQAIFKTYRDVAESLLLFPILGLDALGPRVARWEAWRDVIQFHTVALKPG